MGEVVDLAAPVDAADVLVVARVLLQEDVAGVWHDDEVVRALEIVDGGRLVDELELAATATARGVLPELAELRLAAGRAVEVEPAAALPGALGAVEDRRAR